MSAKASQRQDSGPLKSRFASILEESSFLRHYLWKHRKDVGIGLAALIFVDALEVLPPIFLKEAVETATEGKPRIQLLYIALAYVWVALMQAVGRYGWRMYLVRSSMLAGQDLRQRYTKHLFGLSASFFDRRRIGELMSLATSDIDAVRMALGAGLLTIADAIFFLVTVPVVMFFLSPKLALVALLPLPLIPWLVLRNEREIHSRFDRVQAQFSTLSSMAAENLNGIRIVKAFAREDAQIGRFRKAGEKYIELSLRLARVQTAFGPTLDFTMTLGLVLLLYVGGRGVIDGNVSLGTFVAFQPYIQKMIWPMMAVGLAITHYQRAVASSKRLKEIFAACTDVPEAESPRLPEGAPARPGGAWKTSGRVEFRSLAFRYPGSDKTVLAGIELQIEAGERVAFVGSIGSGKTAILSLLPRLYPVDPGMLLIDGVDINLWPIEELRRQVGYVGQEVFLFSETVVENVAYGLHSWTGSGTGGNPEAAVESATRLASVHEDLLALPEGYRTRLGERGVNLSGGQKQRLTIARAIAKQPSILVMDDALASVDVATEESILRGLRGRPGRNTELISAHRISTVKDSDRIVVLDHGRVVQNGSHSALIRERGGIYWKFHEEQRLKEDLEHYIENVGEQARPDEKVEERR